MYTNHPPIRVNVDGKNKTYKHYWKYHIAPNVWKLPRRHTRTCLSKDCDIVQQWNGKQWRTVLLLKKEQTT